MSQASPDDKSFSLYFQKEPKESYMYAPGMDSDNFEVIAEHKLVSKDLFFMKLDSIKQGNITVKNDKLIVGVMNAFDQILAFGGVMDPLLEDVVVYKDCSNLDILPDFTFTMDGTDYTLTAHDYVTKHLGQC